MKLPKPISFIHHRPNFSIAACQDIVKSGVLENLGVGILSEPRVVMDGLEKERLRKESEKQVVEGVVIRHLATRKMTAQESS